MILARWILRAVLVALFWAAVVVWFCVSSGCTHAPVGCHPGQHECRTDAECEDEEAYFLSAEERGKR